MRAVRSRFIVLTLAVALLSVPPIAASAQSRDDADAAAADRDAALAELREANERVEAALTTFQELESEMEGLTWKVTQLGDRIKDYEGEVRDLRGRAEVLVTNAYMSDGGGLIKVALEVESIQDLMTGQVLLDRATDNDLVAVTRLGAVRREMNRLKDDLDVDQARVVVLRAAAETNVINLDTLQRVAADAYQHAKDTAADELAEYVAEKRRRELEEAARRKGAAAGLPPELTPGFQCPVPGSNFIDTWGAPRDGGARTHKGTDVFAPRGAKVLAVDSGSVSLRTNSRGGITIWLTGDGGHSYYYAHLEGWAAGLSSGDRVARGALIGYVGNSGNARGTPPHVHFQLHPGGGSPVNPFPTLRHYC